MLKFVFIFSESSKTLKEGKQWVEEEEENSSKVYTIYVLFFTHEVETFYLNSK